jgi:hypothetical protein
MATLAVPTVELLAAMEELGLGGWMPAGRVRVRVRREPSGRAIVPVRSLPEAMVPSSGQMPRMAGLVLATVGAAALGLAVAEGGVLSPVRPSPVGRWARGVAAVLTGIGVAAAGVAVLAARARARGAERDPR